MDLTFHLWSINNYFIILIHHKLIVRHRICCVYPHQNRHWVLYFIKIHKKTVPVLALYAKEQCAKQRDRERQKNSNGILPNVRHIFPSLFHFTSSARAIPFKFSFIYAKNRIICIIVMFNDAANMMNSFHTRKRNAFRQTFSRKKHKSESSTLNRVHIWQFKW